MRSGLLHTSDYLKRFGVPDLRAATSPFDPDYDASTVAGHLQQSAHPMSALKISMACWMVTNEGVKSRGLEVQMEFGKTHDGGFTADTLSTWLDQGHRRGLHSDAFGRTNLRPGSPQEPPEARPLTVAIQAGVDS